MASEPALDEVRGGCYTGHVRRELFFERAAEGAEGHLERSGKRTGSTSSLERGASR